MSRHGEVEAKTSFPGSLDILSATLRLPAKGTLPLDRWLAPLCTGLTGALMLLLLTLGWRDNRTRRKQKGSA